MATSMRPITQARLGLSTALASFLVCACLCTLPGSAAETYILAAQEDYPPFQYADHAGTVRGMDVEIITAAAEAGGAKVIFVLVPWSRALEMARKGTVDGVFGCAKNPEREAFLLFPRTPVRVSEIVFFSNDKFPGRIERLEDARPFVVGVVRDFFVSTAFHENGAIRTDVAETSDSLFKKLSADRHPLAAYNRTVGIYVIKELGLSNVRPLPYVIAAYPAYLAIAKASPKAGLAMETFTKSLEKMDRDGTLQRFSRKYE